LRKPCTKLIRRKKPREGQKRTRHEGKRKGWITLAKKKNCSCSTRKKRMKSVWGGGGVVEGQGPRKMAVSHRTRFRIQKGKVRAEGPTYFWKERGGTRGAQPSQSSGGDGGEKEAETQKRAKGPPDQVTDSHLDQGKKRKGQAKKMQNVTNEGGDSQRPGLDKSQKGTRNREKKTSCNERTQGVTRTADSGIGSQKGWVRTLIC